MSGWLRLASARRFVEIVRTRDALLDAMPAQYVSVDGEVVTQTPIRLSVAIEALMLIVPQDYHDREAALP